MSAIISAGKSDNSWEALSLSGGLKKGEAISVKVKQDEV